MISVMTATIITLFLLLCVGSTDAGLSLSGHNVGEEEVAAAATWKGIRNSGNSSGAAGGLFLGKHALERFRNGLRKRYGTALKKNVTDRHLQANDPCVGFSNQVEFVAYGAQWFLPSYAYNCASSLQINVDDMMAHLFSLFQIFSQYE